MFSQISETMQDRAIVTNPCRQEITYIIVLCEWSFGQWTFMNVDNISRYLTNGNVDELLRTFSRCEVCWTVVNWLCCSQMWKCRLVMVLFNYATTSNYAWIFVEALYLHMLLFVSVFSETSGIRWYIILGWSTSCCFLSVCLPVSLSDALSLSLSLSLSHWCDFRRTDDRTMERQCDDGFH